MNKRQKPNRRLASELVQNVRAGRMNAKTLAALNDALAAQMVTDLPFFRWEQPAPNYIVGSHGHQTIAVNLQRQDRAIGSMVDGDEDKEEATLTLLQFNPEQSRACYEAAVEALGVCVVKE